MIVDNVLIIWMGVVAVLLLVRLVSDIHNRMRGWRLDWSDKDFIRVTQKIPYSRVYWLGWWTPFVKPFKSFIYPDVGECGTQQGDEAQNV